MDRPAIRKQPAIRSKAGSASRAVRSHRSQENASVTGFEPQHRRARIAEAAYFKAEARGFAPGFEEADWLAAEQEIDQA